MSKTLFLHIGHYKTGTTALQVFFSQSGAILARNGIDYPNVWMHNAKHSAFAFSILKAAGVGKLMYDYADPVTPQQMWGDLYRHITEEGRRTTLISSEEFMRIGQFPRARDILHDVLSHRPDDLDVKVIAYLRDPASHLQSWYNQLIKMNFPVSDLNMAVNGDIEDIHYDYRRALQTWQDAVGAENMIIRPYVHDRANPAALHQDFMAAMGVDLPADMVTAEHDPNPRMDDRAVELVRLMQNLDLPRPTINAIRSQALAFLEQQDALKPARDEGISQARERARQSLEWLARQPGSSVPAEAFARQLPELRPQAEVDHLLLMGFIFSEFIQLRQRVNKMNIPELETRIAALEARLSGQDNPQ
jgi:hypothetical protein